MINKLKHNTKIKLISLASAMLLWLYVMTIVDPSDTKLFENIPVVISNMNELKENDFVIYPNEELTMDVSISGRLSNIQKIQKGDIHVYGKIEDPMEGKNQVYLRATTSESVTHELENNVIVVNLDKIVQADKKIDIQIEGSSKENIDKTAIAGDRKTIMVSGPRTLVEEVSKVVGVLDVSSKTQDFTSKVNLIPVNKKGSKVDGVELNKSSVEVAVSMLKEKAVPVKLKLKDGAKNEDLLTNYDVSTKNITIKGQKDVVDKIEYIETKEVNLEDITYGIPKDVYLNIPEGVTSNTKYITMKLNNQKIQQKEFVYTKGDLVLKNAGDKDTSKLIIPDNIKVTVDYPDTIQDLQKSDIKIYVDLSKPDSDGKYKIEYESKSEFIKVNINPGFI